jgi:hypothetical protein
MLVVTILLVATLFTANSAIAQSSSDAPPRAMFDVHAGAGFPMGLDVGARMRLLPIVSIETTLGFIPFVPTLGAGINFHTAPSFDLDPAISLLGTYFSSRGTRWIVGSAMFGFLSLHKTSLHSTVRVGVSTMYGKHSDGSHTSIPILPALELSVAYGFR